MNCSCTCLIVLSLLLWTSLHCWKDFSSCWKSFYKYKRKNCINSLVMVGCSGPHARKANNVLLSHSLISKTLNFKKKIYFKLRKNILKWLPLLFFNHHYACLNYSLNTNMLWTFFISFLKLQARWGKKIIFKT